MVDPLSPRTRPEEWERLMVRRRGGKYLARYVWCTRRFKRHNKVGSDKTFDRQKRLSRAAEVSRQLIVTKRRRTLHGRRSCGEKGEEKRLDEGTQLSGTAVSYVSPTIVDPSSRTHKNIHGCPFALRWPLMYIRRGMYRC